MKPYFCKSRCNAARIIEFVVSDDYKITVDVQGGPLRVDLPINGGWLLIERDENNNRRQRMIEYKTNNLWLVERYDIACDGLKYNVVEDAVFQKQFFADDEPKFVEGHSFELPRRTASA